ncbi:MAG: exo-beta-N-acetylmuramidase NamZ domain-containing protein [Terracidiphilus sp.]
MGSVLKTIRFRRGLVFLLAIALIACGERTLAAQATAGSGAHDFDAIDALMQAAVARGNMPGGVVIIGHNGAVVYRKAFGSRSLEPTHEAMTVDTIFDLASLTKVIATTTAVMQLVDEGRVHIDDPVAVYLPDFAQNGKAQITVRELMTHFSGLPPDLDLKEAWHGRDTAFKMAMQVQPTNPPGTRFVYSDINFEVLGFIVQKVTGMPLNEYTATYVFAPLDMTETSFLPPASWVPRIAPTQYDEDGIMLRGVVHDPTARRMGGVAGHAGLFSTADDLAKFAQNLLSDHPKVLTREAIEEMTTPQQPGSTSILRGLGWDIDSPYSSPRGKLFPVGSFGHTGFTGTSIWMDLPSDTYIILLTNAVHPNGKGNVIALRRQLADAAVGALHLSFTENPEKRIGPIPRSSEPMIPERHVTARSGEVQVGIDVLEADGFRELHPDANHPVRIGLVTNQTAVDAHGKRTADVLAHAPGIKLTAIFSPEHGIAGVLDTTAIGNSRDAATGAPVYSVYGEGDAKRRPTDQEMAGVDEIVYDIQDVGVRFYTYESTLGYFLEAAAKAGKEIVVLDRPNPIGGAYVQGPMLDAGRESFVGYWRTPVRHGMTVGELAGLFNSERLIGAKLSVVRMEGWLRGDWFDSTGRVWINPSPNLRSLTEAELYPGLGMIEWTNISVGRGTDTPFEFVGAPWIDAAALASYLNARTIDGVRFVPVNFTPNASNYANQSCGGVNILVTDREALDAPELGLEIVAALEHLYPNDFKIAGLDGLMRNKAALDALTAGEDPRRIDEDWQDALKNFETVRAKYLLY